LKAGVWFRRGRLFMVSPVRGDLSPLSGRNSTYRPVQICGAGSADIGEKTIVDISIGQHWSKYWEENDFDAIYGERGKYPHNYPDSHPQSKSNPQESWCYPLASLGEYRQWIQSVYLEGGKFGAYLKGKVAAGHLPPSVAQLAIAALAPPQIGN
jgi:hypothetical protein